MRVKRNEKWLIWPGLALALAMMLFAGGCGAGAAIAAGTAIAQRENGKKDNPLLPIPVGHLNRIVFLTNLEAPQGRIITMNQDGSGWNSISSGAGSMRTLTFSSPAVSQDGLTVYYTADWFATSPQIMRMSITGRSHERVIASPGIYETPRASWDGALIAFSGYTEREETVSYRPDEAYVTVEQQPYMPDENAQFGMKASGFQIQAKAPYSIGILERTSPTCPPPDYDYGSATTIKFAASDGGAPIPGKDPIGKTYCIQTASGNIIAITVGDFYYSKDMATTRTPGYITFTWNMEGTAIGGGPATLTGSMSGTTKIGMGYNFIRTFDFRKYDLYLATADGSTIVPLIKDGDEDNPARFPCFSPVSSDYLYFTCGELDTDYMDYEMPDHSYICKYDTNGTLTDTTDDIITSVTEGDIDRNCAVSPGGRYLAFTRYIEHPDGAGARSDYDVYMYDLLASPPIGSWLLVDTGEDPRHIGGDDLFPVFSPDGNRVAFQSDQTGDWDIYSIRTDGEELENLTNNYDTNDTMPAWAP